MKVAEIFESFNGEVNGHHQGRIVTFIRLSGCNLKCPYCDTAHTQDPNYGHDISPLLILKEVEKLGHQHICLTGGEPLLNKMGVTDLLHLLWSEGYKISVETNGTMDISPYFRYVESFVVDYKMDLIPKTIKRCVSAFYRLRETDVIKFVVSNKAEALNAMTIVKYHFNDLYGGKAIVAFSPVTPGMSPEELSELLLINQVRNAVISLQIHKIIGFK